MNRSVLVSSFLLVALAGAPSPGQACGEGQFNMGQGMRYQAYLAPRPAAVLVYADAGPSAEGLKLYKGLAQAGHRITVVTDAKGLAEALAAKRFDVVIANFAQVDAVEASDAAVTAKPLLLPVVARNARNAPELHSRFNLFLVDGASLGQYLKLINQAMVHLP